MPKESRPEPGTEDWWRTILTDPSAHFEPARRYFLRLPSSPHCKLCGAPFRGPGGLVLGSLGFRPWEKNPTLCRRCFQGLNRLPPGGAEVPATLLFADVRGSTGLAERTDAAGFAARLRQFYATSSQAIIDEQGLVDKFVGDEIVAIFIPAFNGPHHAVAAIRAAVNMLRATGYGTAEGAPLMIGIGINTGPAFIGTVAVGSEVTDFTALGDTVNVAARLAAEAAGGEVLISDATAEASGLGLDGIPHRQIPLRGHAAPVALRVAGYEALAALSPA